jgi:hypothetical protein
VCEEGSKEEGEGEGGEDGSGHVCCRLKLHRHEWMGE